MLYEFLFPLSDEIGVFRLFGFITFRTGLSLITALVFSFLFGPPIIAWLKRLQGEGQPIRADGPETHLLTKKGTPTMGGVLILLAVAISTLLWSDLSNPYVWIIFMVTTGFGSIGFVDDYLKLTRRSSDGMSSRLKLFAQALVAIAAAMWIMRLSPEGLHSMLAVPFLKNVLLDLGWFFMPFAILVMVGASNAVNLTDGLDGLAIVPIMIAAGCFGMITYLVGNTVFSDYLQVH